MRGEHCLLVGRTVVFAVYNATAYLNQWRHLALLTSDFILAKTEFWLRHTGGDVPTKYMQLYNFRFFFAKTEFWLRHTGGDVPTKYMQLYNFCFVENYEAHSFLEQI